VQKAFKIKPRNISRETKYSIIFVLGDPNIRYFWTVGMKIGGPLFCDLTSLNTWGWHPSGPSIKLVQLLPDYVNQLSSFPMARPLYLLSKKMLSANEHSQYDKHLDTLSVQCKLRNSVQLETCCGSWNRLLLGCHPGQFSFILRAASDTLPTAVNLQHSHIQCDLKCPLWGQQQLMFWVAVLWHCPRIIIPTVVLGCLVSGLSDLLAEDTSVCIYADLPGMRAHWLSWPAH